MLRIYVLTNILLATVYGADHNLFRNCSRVPFCSSFRHLTLDINAQFAANSSAFKIQDDVVTIPLYNANNDKLNLCAYLLQGTTIRIKILEQDHTRYELADILASEQEVLKINTVITKSDSTIFALGDDQAQYKFIVSDGPPFRIDFYYKEELKVIFNGNRLVMQNTNESKAFSFDVEFSQAVQLYGLYHHAYKIGLSDTANGTSDPFRFRNSDTAGYETDSPMALYGSVPAIYGNTGSATSGIFLHNAAEQWVDISYSGTASAHFMVESGTLDLFVLLGPDTKEIVRQFTKLTGVAHLPQLWTLGYHQSRYSYMTQDEVKEVVALMDLNDFPIDAIWLDIDYTDGMRYFTWNPETFVDPVEMQTNLSSTNRKLVTILDPHFKVDDNYAVYAGAKDKYFVKWADGRDYEGNCWPGVSRYMDFLNPEARDYYASWYSYDKFGGSTDTLAGVWNDMNEPSVFDSAVSENTLPFEVLHHGGVPHRDVHNIYGFLQTKATHQGLMQRDDGKKRPFILTRSHFAGSQRYAATWTGDNYADWPYLVVSYSECLTANLLGMVFCGADIGGFIGTPDVELFQRWYQAGAWLPFFRGHSVKESDRREPYLFDKDVQTVIRNAIKLRYKHIPFWYTLFYEHTRYGDPIIRPLFYSYPTYLEYDDHLLLGTDILVRPVFEPAATEVTVTLPSNNNVDYWYRIDDGSWNVQSGPTEIIVPVDINFIPIFYRAGSIIPTRNTERPSTSHMVDDAYTLYVNLDSANTAEGRLYADDYTSFEYLNSNAYLYLALNYLADTNKIQISYIDDNANSTGFRALIQSVVIHRINANLGPSLEYTTTSDGTPLISIDIVEELQKRRSMTLMKIATLLDVALSFNLRSFMGLMVQVWSELLLQMAFCLSQLIS